MSDPKMQALPRLLSHIRYSTDLRSFLSIVLGSLEGRIEEAFSKLATLHEKNRFTLAILTGNPFSPSCDETSTIALLGGQILVPLPTYFTVGTEAFPPSIVERLATGQDICENLHFLGRRSITRTTDGVSIATLGGSLESGAGDEVAIDDEFAPFHSTHDVKHSGTASSGGVDVLLTAVWPNGVWKGSKCALDATPQDLPSSEVVAAQCVALKPRYHFATAHGDLFYEREPFSHPMDHLVQSNAAVTRFISLAPFGNEAKAKALYAFSLPSASSAPPKAPVGLTLSPFHLKRRMETQGQEFRRFADVEDSSERSHKRRRQIAPPPGPDKCFFCLSNPSISSHMCCSIGDESYVATAKGPLTTTTTFQEQGFNIPGHFLIIPFSHQPTLSSLGSSSSSDNEAVRTLTEMNRFREALQAMVSSSSSHQLGAVTWEINRLANIHVHWQFIAVPAVMVQRQLVEEAFRTEAEALKYPAFTPSDPALDEQAALGDYFRLWTWADDGSDNIKGQSLIMPLSPHTRFDLQFGRRVLAKLLGLNKRVAWRDCEQSKDEEIKDANLFRKAFQPWDFTL